MSIKPLPKVKTRKKEQVQQMFNEIAYQYDLINKIMTMNMDKGWRKKVCKLALKNNQKKILDIATDDANIEDVYLGLTKS